MRSFLRYWRWSRPQFVVALVTVGATLLWAPRVERGLLLGVATALAVHLWRELHVGVPTRLEDGCLHLWPQGVLYFGSAPGLEQTFNQMIAAQPDLTSVVIHLRGLGRVDLTGALMLGTWSRKHARPEPGWRSVRLSAVGDPARACPRRRRGRDHRRRAGGDVRGPPCSSARMLSTSDRPERLGRATRLSRRCRARRLLHRALVWRTVNSLDKS